MSFLIVNLSLFRSIFCVLWAVWSWVLCCERKKCTVCSWVLCCAVSCLACHAGSFSVQNCNRSGNCNATDIFGGTAWTLFVFFLTHFGNKFQQHAEEHIGEERYRRKFWRQIEFDTAAMCGLVMKPVFIIFPCDHIWIWIQLQIENGHCIPVTCGFSKTRILSRSLIGYSKCSPTTIF